MGVFLFYLVTHAFLSALCYYFIYHQHSFASYNLCLKINSFTEFLCLLLFILYEINSRYRVQIFSILMISFSLLFIYEQINYDISEFKSGTTIFEFITLLIVTIIYFFRKLVHIDNERSIITKKFIMIIGVFLYFSGNFFFMLLVEISKSSTFENKRNLTLVYCSITIIKNIIISIGLSLPEKPKNPDNFIPFPDELEINTIQNTHNLG
jgi:hypothetical protein